MSRLRDHSIEELEAMLAQDTALLNLLPLADDQKRGLELRAAREDMSITEYLYQSIEEDVADCVPRTYAFAELKQIAQEMEVAIAADTYYKYWSVTRGGGVRHRNHDDYGFSYEDLLDKEKALWWLCHIQGKPWVHNAAYRELAQIVAVVHKHGRRLD